MNKLIKIVIAVLLFGILFLIRAYETELFYDPLIIYFQNDYLYSTIPEIDHWRLIIDLFKRYCMNSIVTIAIVYLFFRKISYAKFSGFSLMLAFLVMIFIFSTLLRSEFESGYLLPFYIRRFIVHPVFLLILLPAFYYYSKTSSKN